MTTLFAGGALTSTTPDQEEILEDWRGAVVELFTQRAWNDARVGLMRTGVSEEEAEEAMLTAVEELIENGWDDYL